MSEDDVEIANLVQKVQGHVFKRRIRAKEPFTDFDPLRSGRCTAQQFVRAVNVLMPELTDNENHLLASYFADNHAQYPQVVNYRRFTRAVDHVFTTPELERSPWVPVPRPGAALPHSLNSAAYTLDAFTKEDLHFNRLLCKLALLVKTRGILFRSCFQDCERSDSTSLMNPRYSGKVTPAQFRQHFPFVKDFSEAEVEVFAKRYSTGEGDVHFLALDKDLGEVGVDLATATQTIVEPSDFPSVPGTARRAQPKEVLSCEGVMDKLRSTISLRRLRIHDIFRDFDRLRRGVCSVHQLNAVFTVLGIEVDPREVDELGTVYLDRLGMFRYSEFCRDLMDMADVLPPTSSSKAPATSRTEREAPEKFRFIMESSTDANLELLETQLRKRIQQRSLPVKAVFQDFDRINTGRVSRIQFARVMAMLNIELSEKEVDLLCGAYGDSERRGDFRYLDFCAAVDVRADRHLGLHPMPRPSKYFGRKGEVHPLMSQRPLTR